MYSYWNNTDIVSDIKNIIRYKHELARIKGNNAVYIRKIRRNIKCKKSKIKKNDMKIGIILLIFITVIILLIFIGNIIVSNV